MNSCKTLGRLATPVALACAALAAQAQTQPQPQPQAPETTKLDQVQVTGIRSAIESAISLKRNADAIIEAISAEDLGKLPDTSIAESLARLPGLAAQRVNGTTSAISIRGMAPGFGVTLLNGREMVSGGSDRSVEFDQFPAELLSGATVYKTPDAALGTQGLSGTVNMRTVRPLDFKGRQGNVNARMEASSNSEQIPGISNRGNRLSASFIDQSTDRKFGYAIGVAHLDSPTQQQHYANWWFANTARTDVYDPAANGCDPDCGIPGLDRDAVSLQAFEATAFATSQVRNGVMSVLEYKPSDNAHTVLDLYYSTYRKKFEGREFQGGMSVWAGSTYVNPVYGDHGGDKVVLGGTINNIDGKVVSRANMRRDKIAALGLNHEQKLGDGWSAVGDISWSRADRDESTSEMYAGPGRPSGFTSTDISMTGFSHFVPSVDWADPSLVSLQGYWGQLGESRVFRVRDDLKSARATARKSLDWGPVQQIEFGLNYVQRSKDYSAIKYAYDLKSGENSLAFPAGILKAPATLGFGSLPSVANFFVGDLLATGLFSARLDDLSSAPDRQWAVREKVATAFGKLDLDFDIGVPVHGNIGLQVVRSRQEGRGLAWLEEDATTVPVSGGKNRTDVLPSLNLAADFGAGTTLRLGVARVLARPNMEDMRAGVSGITRSTTGQGLWSASGGNPRLDPWRADAFDLSLEKYFDKHSYVSLAAFRKNLKSTVYAQRIAWDFTGYPDPLKGDPRYPIRTYDGQLDTVANGNGGYVQGTELTVSLDAGRLSSLLDGFGAMLSQSNTRSNIHQNNDLNNPLEGLSGTVRSVVFYYEKHGFEARIAQRYRSRYMASVRNIWGDIGYTTIEPERIADLQFGYNFETGPLKGLSVNVEVNNLTDEPYQNRMTVDSNSGKVPGVFYPGVYEKYGRQYLIGLNYKF